MTTKLSGGPVSMSNESLDRRLHDIGWGLLLMLTGMIWLVPAERVPGGAWCSALRRSCWGVNLVAKPLLTKAT